MKEFSYLDYTTIYSCKGDCEQALAEEACFGRVFVSLPYNKCSSVKYKIYIIKGLGLAAHEHKGNACLLTREQLFKHVKRAQQICPFTFSIHEGTYEDHNSYIVYINISKKKAMYHKYILSWIRYTYEYPYNVILIDALRLKQDPLFQFTSVATLFNVVLAACPFDIRDVHKIGYGRFLQQCSIKELKEKLNKVDALNNVYHRLSKDTTLVLNDHYDEYDSHDIEYWSAELFEKVRKPNYLKIFNKIKK